ncbi:MAG: DUF4038 domain-containing protein [Bilifractor sp.]
MEQAKLVKAVDTHFEYEDGTWFCPVGTTIYALAYQPQERLEETFETLSNAPFNKVRMCVFPKWFVYNREEPEIFPFEVTGGKIDVHRPVERFWTHLEQIIDRLGSLGIQCDLILLHPYDKWGFSKMPCGDVVTYLRYVVGRIGRFDNVWWSMANEYDIMVYSQEEWRGFMKIVRERDRGRHLLSIHDMIIPWDFSQEEVTHSCLQIKSVEKVSQIVARYRKPLMVDECCYEGNLPFEWGNISGKELVNRFWKVYCQGAYATHGETFLSPDQVLWWSKGGKLKGESTARIAFLKQILCEIGGPLAYNGQDLSWREMQAIMANPPEFMKDSPMVNLAGRITEEQAMQMMLDSKVYSSSYGDRAYLKYFGSHCTAIGDIDLPSDRSYRVWVIDTWEMTRNLICEDATGHFEADLPGKEGMALLAIVKEE